MPRSAVFPTIAALALAGTLFGSMPASAQYRDQQDWRRHGDWHGNRGYRGGGRDNTGALVGGALLGLGLGAILGGVIAAPPAYYAPPPAYYAPPPAYYAPPPVIYARPPAYYPPPAYYGD